MSEQNGIYSPLSHYNPEKEAKEISLKEEQTAYRASLNKDPFEALKSIFNEQPEKIFDKQANKERRRAFLLSLFKEAFVNPDYIWDMPGSSDHNLLKAGVLLIKGNEDKKSLYKNKLDEYRVKYLTIVVRLTKGTVRINFKKYPLAVKISRERRYIFKDRNHEEALDLLKKLMVEAEIYNLKTGNL